MADGMINEETRYLCYSDIACQATEYTKLHYACCESLIVKHIRVLHYFGSWDFSSLIFTAVNLTMLLIYIQALAKKKKPR